MPGVTAHASRFALQLQILAAGASLIALSASGCAGGSSDLAAPGVQPGPVDGATPSKQGTELGAYRLIVPADGLDARLESVREGSAIGDAYTVDLSEAFRSNNFNCLDCLKVTSVIQEFVDNERIVELTFVARHPFPTPETGARADLHVTNARLAFLVDGTESYFGYGSHPQVTGDLETVENADGYTVLPESLVPAVAGLNANLFPFRVFATSENDNLNDGTGNYDDETGWEGRRAPTGFNALPMGGDAEVVVRLNLTRVGTLDFETEVVLFGDYIVPATADTRAEPVYYMPEGAMAAAWRVSPEPMLHTTANTSAGTVPLGLEVWDWQHAASVDPGFPNPVNPGGVRTDGRVAEVVAHVPAFGASGQVAATTAPLEGVGRPSSPLEYSLTVTRPANAPEGTHRGLVKVVDARDSLTALQRDLETPAILDDIATYQRFEVEVVAPWRETVLPFAGTLRDDPLVLLDRPWLLVAQASGGAWTGSPTILTTNVDSPQSAADWVGYTLPSQPADRLVGVNGSPVLLGFDPVGVTSVAFASTNAPMTAQEWNAPHEVWTLADQTAALGPVAVSHGGMLAFAIRENGHARLIRAIVDFPASNDDYVAASMFDGTPMALASVGGRLTLAYTSPASQPVPAYARALVTDPLGLPDWFKFEFAGHGRTSQISMAHRGSRPLLWFNRTILGEAELRLAMGASAEPETIEDWDVRVIGAGVEYGLGDLVVGDGHYLIGGMRMGLSARQPFVGRSGGYDPSGPSAWEFEYPSTLTAETFTDDLQHLAARLVRTDTDLYVVRGARNASIRVLQGPPDW